MKQEDKWALITACICGIILYFLPSMYIGMLLFLLKPTHLHLYLIGNIMDIHIYTGRLTFIDCLLEIYVVLPI